MNGDSTLLTVACLANKDIMDTNTRHNSESDLIRWNDQQHALGLDTMDATHREFIAMINTLHGTPDKDFGLHFKRLYVHMEKHFEHEYELMKKSSFPAISEHSAEHRRILGELQQFNRRVQKGLYAFGRAYIRDTIQQWFHLHLITMDSALAAHLKNRQQPG